METGERLTDHRAAVWEILELGTPLSKVQIGLGADSLIKERLGAVEIRLALDFLPKNHLMLRNCLTRGGEHEIITVAGYLVAVWFQHLSAGSYILCRLHTLPPTYSAT